MAGYEGFWLGRGVVGVAPVAQPRQQLQNPPDEPQVPPPQTSWLDRAERGAAVAQAWVTLAEKVVGLLFKVLILVAASWCVWGGLGVVAEGKATWRPKRGHGPPDAP